MIQIAGFPRDLRDAIVLLLGIVFVPLLALVVVGFLDARAESYRMARERVVSLARIAQLAEQRLVADTRQSLFILSHAPGIATGDGPGCSEALRDVMQASIIFSNMGVADANGDIVCSAQVMTAPVNIADRLYFRRTMGSLDFAMGDYQVGRITGKPVITFSHPVFNTRRSVVRSVVFAALDVAWLTTRLRQADLPDDVNAWLLNEEGRVLASLPDRSWVGQVVSGSALGRAVLDTGTEAVVTELDDLDGQQRLYAVAPVWSGPDGSMLRVAVGQPVSDVYAGVNRELGLHLVLLLAASVLLVVVVRALSRRLVLHPLDGLVDATRRLTAGDLGARVAEPMEIAEFAHFAETFNELAATLQERDRALARHVEGVERLSRKYAVLSGTNQTIVRAPDESSLFRTICDVVVDRGMGLASWIGQFEDDDGEVLCGAAAQAAEWPLAEGITIVSAPDRTRRLRGGHVVVVDLDEGDRLERLPFEDEARSLGARHYIGIPVLRNRRAVACLNVYAGPAPIWRDREGLDLVHEMAGDIAFALATFDKESEIERLAFHDSLTGLPNRHLFEKEVDRTISSAAGQGMLVPVIKIEITSLRRRIDRFGHDAGDFVLRNFAAELKAIMPDEAVVARTGDDLFAVMLAPAHEAGSLRQRIEALIHALPTRLRYGGQEVALEFHAGVATFPEDGDSAKALMRASLLALDTLHRSPGGAVAFHSARLSVQAHERWQIERHLTNAVAAGELMLEYQPTHRLDDGAFVGVEALLRWHSADLGVVPPGKFVPIAEQSGQIVAIGYWVFEETCRQMQAWFGDGARPDYASVNVSAVQLHDPGFADRVAAILEAHPAARGHIAIEITETAMMEDHEHTRDVLMRLKDLGFSLFVDDFGTGYSSLSYLRRLPVDTLKIDLAFVSELGISTEALSVVRAILALGSSLGLATIAEGIENTTQARILTENGCDVGQGYLFGRSMPPDAIATLFLRPTELPAS